MWTDVNKSSQVWDGEVTGERSYTGGHRWELRLTHTYTDGNMHIKHVPHHVWPAPDMCQGPASGHRAKRHQATVDTTDVTTRINHVSNFTTSFNCQVNFVTELDLPTDVNIHQDIYIHHYLCDNVLTVCVTPNLYDTLLLYVYLYILFP